MPIQEAEFDYLRRFMLAHSAMVIDSDKSYLAEARLASVVREEGFPSVEDLVRRLKLDGYGPLQRKVVDALTNHETWFFRDHEPFELLRTTLLPESRARCGGERPVVVWSAASSTGQEPASIAMIAKELWPDAAKRVRIIGTDVSQPILERARKGRFSQLEINRGLPASMLTRYFRRTGLEWELSREIMELVEFRWMNLADAWGPMPPVDIVFLRNLLIYFSLETKREILAKMYKVLVPGGVLLLGAAETTLGLHDEFERVPAGKINFYRKRSK